VEHSACGGGGGRGPAGEVKNKCCEFEQLCFMFADCLRWLLDVDANTIYRLVVVGYLRVIDDVIGSSVTSSVHIGDVDPNLKLNSQYSRPSRTAARSICIFRRFP